MSPPGTIVLPFEKLLEGVSRGTRVLLQELSPLLAHAVGSLPARLQRRAVGDVAEQVAWVSIGLRRNLRELVEIDASLGEALDACNGMWVNIKIKNWPEDVDFDETDRLAASVAGLLEVRNEDSRWVISAFNRPTVDAMRTLAPTVRTAWLTLGVRDEDIDKVARDLANSGHIAIHPWDRFLTRKSVETCHSHGLQVNVWTVDDPVRMRELMAWGVDGIVTNVPDVALKVRAEFGGTSIH